MTEPMLAPQPRRRALAELDARIAQAEAVRAQRLTAIQAKPATKMAAHFASVAVHVAQERLDMLRRSRATLEKDEGE